MATDAANRSAESVQSVTFTGLKPQVFVEDLKANEAVAFYKAAFGAEEVNRLSHPKRKADHELPLVLSAEIKLGSSTMIVSDIADDSTAPKSIGTGLVFCLETEDIEAAVEKAVKAGATTEGEVTKSEGGCHGRRVGKVKDPYGILWLICNPAGDVEA